MARQTVAIVDDRITNLKILERLAGSLGDTIEVRTFAHPQEALDYAIVTPPDLLITDFNMPDLNGAEFIRRLRQHPNCADLPVIVVTAYEDRDLRLQALEAGATDYLLSPVDHREFRVRSANLLTLQRQQLMLKERASTLEEKIQIDERRHRDELQSSHEMLLRVIDAMPVMVSATDRDGRFMFVNSSFALRFGWPAADMIGKLPSVLRNDSETRMTMERHRQIIDGNRAPGAWEQEIAMPSGQRRVLLNNLALLRDGNGQSSIVVSAALDITDRKEAELALVAAKEEAELASRSKTEFLANMSHELRTPLNAIIGFSQLMADEVMGPLGSARYTSYARDICASGQHLLSIIGDILDVSKLEAGRIEIDEEELEIGQVIRDLLHLVVERARSLDIAIDLDLPADLPRVRGDALKLKQVLLNLITNAIKFSHAGGRVVVRGAMTPDGLHLAVVDHGIGMDEHEIKTAITRFGQVASPWSRKHHGTGLGLPLAIGLVELHDGRLTIDSVKGQGTTVTIVLPLSRLVRTGVAVGA
ncbi:MAG TPA: ATP-binding protein [Stellaceae bacterium]|nr:ATP-binding protein [Stellaceae bacterium]